MKLIDEMRRRNVFRVGAAYAVVAWVLVQLADILLGNFGAPEWVFRAFAIVLALGFPLAVFLAWAYELTPDGIRRSEDVPADRPAPAGSGRRTDRLILAGLAVAVLLLLADRFWPSREAELPPARAAEEPGEAIEPAEIELPGFPERSVAVLPFADLSPDGDQGYFADGMTEEILATLARLDGLRVISRTSVMRYKGSGKSIPEIALELGAGVVLEGSVRRAGNTVRITAQLIDPRTDHHLWADSYDRTLTAENLFTIQGEIARSISRALHAEVTEAARERIAMQPTGNLAAYDLYLRGRNLASEGQHYEAMERYREAIALDPGFAMAEVALAEAHVVLFFVESRDIHAEAARAALQRAMETDPDLPEALALYGVFLGAVEGRAGEIREILQRAAELNPNSARVLWALATFARVVEGDLEAALSHAMRARMIAPMDQFPLSAIAGIYENAGEFALARRWYQAIERVAAFPRLDWHLARIELYEGNPDAAARRAEAFWQQVGRSAGLWRDKAALDFLLGDLDGAREAWERERELLVGETFEQRIHTGLAWVYHQQGEAERAEPLLAEAEALARRWVAEGRRPVIAPCVLAEIHATRGALDRAMDSLEQMLPASLASCLEHGTDPRFEILRGTPRFEALVGRKRDELARIRGRLPRIDPS